MQANTFLTELFQRQALSFIKPSKPDPLSDILAKPFSLLIMGTGEASLAILNWCLQRMHESALTAQIFLTDTRPSALLKLENDLLNSQNPIHQKLLHALNDKKKLSASSPLKLIEIEEAIDLIQAQSIELLTLTPGLSPLDAAMQNIIKYAEAAKTYITSEWEIFQYELKSFSKQFNQRIDTIAITGTNGKTTTTQLCAHLFNEYHYQSLSSHPHGEIKAVVAGNISPSLLQQLLEQTPKKYIKSLDASNETSIHIPNIWVLELSSFQLSQIASFHASAAVLLNITEDHCDWHGDMQDYLNSKLKILGAAKKNNHQHQILEQSQNISQQISIYYADDMILKNHMTKENSCTSYISFSNTPPNSQHIWGIEEQRGQKYLSYHSKRQQKNIQLLPINALKIHGLHNARNALAALAICTAIINQRETELGLGASEESIIQKLLAGLRTYQGEPHRVEFVGLLPNQAQVYDDSKGTNVGATIAAIEGLSDGRQNILLIAGGDAKGQDFSPLKHTLKHLRALYLIGKDASQLAAIAEHTPYFFYNTLEEATQAACQDAMAGDIILLSPACASLDMFKNYAHRAQVFRQSIQSFEDLGGL